MGSTQAQKKLCQASIFVKVSVTLPQFSSARGFQGWNFRRVEAKKTLKQHTQCYLSLFLRGSWIRGIHIVDFSGVYGIVAVQKRRKCPHSTQKFVVPSIRTHKALNPIVSPESFSYQAAKSKTSRTDCPRRGEATLLGMEFL